MNNKKFLTAALTIGLATGISHFARAFDIAQNGAARATIVIAQNAIEPEKRRFGRAKDFCCRQRFAGIYSQDFRRDFADCRRREYCRRRQYSGGRFNSRRPKQTDRRDES